jgi:hypothetical protein
MVKGDGASRFVTNYCHAKKQLAVPEIFNVELRIEGRFKAH